MSGGGPPASGLASALGAAIVHVPNTNEPAASNPKLRKFSGFQPDRKTAMASSISRRRRLSVCLLRLARLSTVKLQPEMLLRSEYSQPNTTWMEL